MEAKFVILYRVESSRGVDLKLYNSNYYDSFFLVISVWVTDAIPMRNNVTIEWMSYRSPIDCNSPRVIPAYKILNN